MDTKAKSQFRLLFPCYFSFFVNGAMVLLVGAILPYIIEEAGINYSVAGGFLSAFAIGNLLASFVNPPMASRIGRKATIVVFSAFIPVMLLVITYFNTSNVTIQPLLARIAASLFPISIHLMLLFNILGETTVKDNG